jgi:hypothetical protein
MDTETALFQNSPTSFEYQCLMVNRNIEIIESSIHVIIPKFDLQERYLISRCLFELQLMGYDFSMQCVMASVLFLMKTYRNYNLSFHKIIKKCKINMGNFHELQNKFNALDKVRWDLVKSACNECRSSTQDRYAYMDIFIFDQLYNQAVKWLEITYSSGNIMKYGMLKSVLIMMSFVVRIHNNEIEDMTKCKKYPFIKRQSVIEDFKNSILDIKMEDETPYHEDKFFIRKRLDALCL